MCAYVFQSVCSDSFCKIVSDLKRIEGLQDTDDKTVNKKAQGSPFCRYRSWYTNVCVSLFILTKAANSKQEEKLICDMILLCVVSSACMQYFRTGFQNIF